MKINIHRSEERKVSEFKEVVIKHSFNYGSFFNPLREKFGVLRVLNDERLEPGFCFNERFHKHIEVLILPLNGSISCKDSTGRIGNADSEGALLISTGSGLSYTVCNSSPQESAEVIEIWIFAHKNDGLSGISEMETSKQNRIGKLQLIATERKTVAGERLFQNVTGEKSDAGLLLNQNALVWRVDIGENESVNYNLKVSGNVLLLFIVKGEVMVGKDAIKANERDSVELTEVDSDVYIMAVKESELIIIEVPVD